MKKSASFVLIASISLYSLSPTTAYLMQISQPTIVVGIPDCSTTFAASGSTQMLNSAAGVWLPRY